MTLTDAIKFLNTTYPQLNIEIETFDFETKSIKKITQPKYLFRGESSLYSKTETTYFRKLQSNIFNLTQWHQIKFATSNLYLFLRKEFWNISIDDNSYDDSRVEIYIVGLLQHYGFDTSFIDLTSDLNVVANFCSDSSIGSSGNILVIPTANIIEHCFDLTQCPGVRPKRQKAFTLWDFKTGLDLKNNQFLTEYVAEWINFTLSDDDKRFNNPDYFYPVKNDNVVKSIIDWYDYSHIKLKLDDSIVINYLNDIITKLKNYGG
jgi:hypothetical protein